MKIITQDYYNPRATVEANPNEIIREAFSRINNVLKCLTKVKPELLEDYLAALQKIFVNEVKDYQIDSNLFDLNQLTVDLTTLNLYPELCKIILASLCKRMNLPKDYQSGQEKVPVILLHKMQAMFHVAFYRVKAFTDVLGREAGIKFWKELAQNMMEDAFKKLDKEIIPPLKEKFDELALEEWGKIGSQFFTAVIYDDYKAFLKVDRCIVHEAFKEFNDSELAFLSYGYLGSLEDSLNKGVRRRKTPVTLFQGDFCVEFFYNNGVHPDAEPPPLEEIAKIGKD